jgi:hypothetical protein
VIGGVHVRGFFRVVDLGEKINAPPPKPRRNGDGALTRSVMTPTRFEFRLAGGLFPAAPQRVAPSTALATIEGAVRAACDGARVSRRVDEARREFSCWSWLVRRSRRRDVG